MQSLSSSCEVALPPILQLASPWLGIEESMPSYLPEARVVGLFSFGALVLNSTFLCSEFDETGWFDAEAGGTRSNNGELPDSLAIDLGNEPSLAAPFFETTSPQASPLSEMSIEE